MSATVSVDYTGIIHTYLPRPACVGCYGNKNPAAGQSLHCFLCTPHGRGKEVGFRLCDLGSRGARRNLVCVFIHVLDYTGIDLHDSYVYFDDREVIPPH